MPGYDSTARVPFNKGGRVGLREGGVKTKAFKKAKDKKEDIKFMETVHEKKFGDRPKMKKDSPHSTLAGYQSVEQRKHGTTQSKTTGIDKRLKNKSGGRIGLKKGGDDKWIQKVDASIKRRGTKGKCTPITKPGCTGRAKALAKTFKKMGRERKAS